MTWPLSQRAAGDPVARFRRGTGLSGGRMPRMLHTIPVTVGGLGPFRGLHLGFSGEEWAKLPYEPEPSRLT